MVRNVGRTPTAQVYMGVSDMQAVAHYVVAELSHAAASALLVRLSSPACPDCHCAPLLSCPDVPACVCGGAPTERQFATRAQTVWFDLFLVFAVGLGVGFVVARQLYRNSCEALLDDRSAESSLIVGTPIPTGFDLSDDSPGLAIARRRRH